MTVHSAPEPAATPTPIPAEDITEFPETPGPHYPQRDTYQFQEFAGLVFELGGYGDVTLCDPYTGRRLHLMHAFDGPDGQTLGLFDAMRKVIDAAEQVGWGTPESD